MKQANLGRSFPERAWHDGPGLGPAIKRRQDGLILKALSDSNRQAITREFGCMQAIVFKRGWRITCSTEHLVLTRAKPKSAPSSRIGFAIFKQKSGEVAGLASCYVTNLRNGHTAWLLGTISREILCFPPIPSSCSHNASNRIFTGL